MCIRDSGEEDRDALTYEHQDFWQTTSNKQLNFLQHIVSMPVSYTHLRAHETVLDLVCRLLLEKKKKHKNTLYMCYHTL